MNFIMQFIICNGLICVLTGIILTAKHYLQKHTTVKSRYLCIFPAGFWQHFETLLLILWICAIPTKESPKT